MVKRYLVSEDEFSGKVVIICKSEEVMVDVYEPTIQDINANMYLYRDYPAKYEIKIQYTVEAYFNYKEGMENNNNRILHEVTFDKNEANELFKQAKLLTR